MKQEIARQLYSPTFSIYKAWSLSDGNNIDTYALYASRELAGSHVGRWCLGFVGFTEWLPTSAIDST